MTDKKKTTIEVTVDSEIRKEVESILRDLGLTEEEVIRLFYAQIALTQGIPFRIQLPRDY